MDLTRVYITSAIGIAIILSIITCNNSILKSKKMDYKMLRYMLIIVAFSCFFDAIVFTVDGKEGELFRFANMLGNTVIFVATIGVSLFWNAFIIYHLYGYTSKARRWVRRLSVPVIIICIVALINWFFPIVFVIGEDNVYRRTIFTYLYAVIAFAYIFYSAYVHITFKNKRNVIFFPIGVFLFPVLVGLLAQSLFYGVSTGWVGVAIGLSSAFMSIQKESAYIDGLTGLLNRAYLFSSKLYKGTCGGIMIDINRFKMINDTCGHNVGDKALQDVANILLEAASDRDFVIRYAGDEFLIFITEGGSETLEKIKSRIMIELDRINSIPGRRYNLSLAFGLGEFDPDRENFDKFIHKLDTNMYIDKEQYYRTHTEFSRRREK